MVHLYHNDNANTGNTMQRDTDESKDIAAGFAARLGNVPLVENPFDWVSSPARFYAWQAGWQRANGYMIKL